jgi:nitrogen fixation/metabolism regulation signal transduction histidine kinase
MRKNIIARFPAAQLKSKLIAVFALISLIPTVCLIFVSHLIIARRWQGVSAELQDLLVLPMVENAMEIASDSSFVQALEDGTDLSEVDFGLSEDYILMIYDASGKRLFSAGDELILKGELDSLEAAGLPPIDQFRPWEPIIPREIKVRDKELALSAVICQSTEDDKTLGVVVIGKVIPSALADIRSKTVIAVLTLTAALIFLIALWISSLIAREITGPIQELVAGTREVAGGNLDYQVSIDARDEVGMLADSFNQMTMKLRRNAEELRRAEKAATWREIAQKLAHEIKNPLTPIQLSAERLRRRYDSKREGYERILNECTSTIVDEVERLRRLLDEFSRLARMPRVDPVPWDVNSIVQKAIKLYGEFPENVEVETQYADNLPQALVDPEQMERAFFNVIKNAIEAMSDGGRLTVSTRAFTDSESKQQPPESPFVNGESKRGVPFAKGDIEIEVEFADTGPGISADSMEKLFIPHFSTKRGGAGLGLAIVQKIVSDHGGDVTVESEEGKGAVFTLRIPISEGAGNSNGRYNHLGSGRRTRRSVFPEGYT